MAVAALVRPRRPQAERRATTRGTLLDAAVACLVERGYVGTTTPAVCARAGLSQGALFKHFPTKPALAIALARDAVAAVPGWRLAGGRRARRAS